VSLKLLAETALKRFFRAQALALLKKGKLSMSMNVLTKAIMGGWTKDFV